MTHFKHLMATVVLASVASSALAASSVDLAVTGSIVPTACTPTLSLGDTSYRISSADLNLDDLTNIREHKYQTLNINCQAPTLFGIRGIDNRAGSVGNGWYQSPYGLGLTPAGEKIGSHMITVIMSRSTIDGKPAFVTVGSPDGSTWYPSETTDRSIRNDGQLLGFTDTPGVTTGPIPVKDAALGLDQFLLINAANSMTLNEEVPLDGSAILEVVYL
ncbi:hypothetical protein PMM47T1_04869 [Pseudomonas sp. M47T1]|uniref:DUF1120 domain-containing protein n=1 Tax=Pseudomonas sp. M47T1 TaxID=1179778 RepID=UPI0002608286|nr:DUF1120 domain-containing protein [Pseudomonas sp. M47T1]EIK97816.1 hypothetical protein PMM47T1_04869 [Pseudomonas sp. M47T1]